MMVEDPTRPSLEERYARAIDVTDMTVSLEHRTPVDLLIGAGWTRETLGTALYRLKTEFDAVRGERRLVEDRMAVYQRSLVEAQRAARDAAATWRPPALYPNNEVDEPARLEREMAAYNITALSLILVELKTLRDTRNALGRYAVAYATRQKYMVPDATVVQIAGKALQYWLDPQCHACQGRGFNGGFGLPLELCKACHGTKKREASFHHTAAGHEFARALLCEMDRKTEHVNTMLKRFLASGAQVAKRGGK